MVSLVCGVCGRWCGERVRHYSCSDHLTTVHSCICLIICLHFIIECIGLVVYPVRLASSHASASHLRTDDSDSGDSSSSPSSKKECESGGSGRPVVGGGAYVGQGDTIVRPPRGDDRDGTADTPPPYSPALDDERKLELHRIEVS